MKSSVKINSTNSKPKYPYLGVYNDAAKDLVVLFTKPRKGVCLSVDTTNRIGEGGEWDEHDFIPLRGSVTLEND